MGRAQPEQGGGIVNVAVMTGALGYREYNTTLMTVDGLEGHGQAPDRG